MTTATTTPATQRIVAYHRVSTAEQSTERHVSLETQAKRVVAYAERAGGAVVGAFTDVASGRKDNRREYQEMLKFVRAGHADVIAVQFLDRFGRNPREILSRIWALQEFGVEVIATDEDIREELVLLVRAGLAGAESKRTSERVKATMRDAARKGRRGGTPPYGYRLVVEGPSSRHYEHNSDEVRTIRRAIDLIEGEQLGYLKLAERLETEGLRTRSGKPWTAAALQRILNNPALIGRFTLGAHSDDVVVVDDFYDPPVLSRQEWDALQARLSLRREHPRGRTHTSDYLLSGIARCGYCEGPMNGQKTTSRGHAYYRYICASRMRSRAFCEHWNNHSRAGLETAVLDYLGRYSDPARVRTLLAATERTSKGVNKKRLLAFEGELAKLDADLRADLDLLRRGFLDDRDFAVANAGRRDRREALEAQKASLSVLVEAELANEHLASTLPDRIRSFTETMRAADVRVAKAELQTILKAVYVTGNDIEIEFRH